MAHLTRKFKVSERRAFRLVGQNRSSNRYEPRPSDFEAKLVERMHALSEKHPRWGYRMVHGLLVEEGWPVNKKRIERLWRREGLKVPPRKAKASGQKARGDDSNSTRRLPALYRNHVWSYDFIKRRTSDGRSFRVLNVIDEFTRLGVGSHVARGIGAKGVQAHMEKLFAIHGKPTLIRADNGREFIADTLLDWLGDQQVRGVFIAKASPCRTRGFQISELADGGYRMQFFSPARNAGYGKVYVQEIDEAGVVVREYKHTMGPDGLIETKGVHGDWSNW